MVSLARTIDLQKTIDNLLGRSENKTIEITLRDGKKAQGIGQPRVWTVDGRPASPQQHSECEYIRRKRLDRSIKELDSLQGK